MAVNAGEVSVALTLDDAEFLANLEAARASLEDFAEEIASLAAAPEVTLPNALASGANASAQFAAAGADAGRAFGAQLTAALGGAATGAEAAAAGLASSVAARLNEGAMGASLAGANLSLSYATGISAGTGTASASASGVANAAAGAIRSAASSASSAGRNFSSGLASGILAGRSGVISAAASVARAAAAAARAELAIHSPSKVTEQFGEYFDMGFIRGVERLTPDIERSVRSAIQVEPPAGAAFGAAERAPVFQLRGQSIDYDALADAMNQRQMVLTMNNRRVAEVQTRETARAQSARNRRIALGYGK